MANCSTYGFAGSNVPLPDLVATGTALNCFLSGFTQAADTLSAQVYANATGTGSPTLLATITGGGSPAMKAMSTASFQIQSGTSYYAVVTDSSNGQTPQVLYNYDTLSYGTTSYAGAVTLAVEDTPNGGDCDFNDALISITWTLYQS